jgi:predicted transcriptional regulator YheO
VTDADVAVEFLVEPFIEGAPGNHVEAAISAFSGRGIDVDLGPFSSVAHGSLDKVGEAIGAMVVNALRSGATNISLQVAKDYNRLGSVTLHDALEGMMRAAEREVGTGATTWTRADKQRVVRMLDERGAFLLRGAVDDIANAMGVSRITIYNYLNAIDTTSGQSDG